MNAWLCLEMSKRKNVKKINKYTDKTDLTSWIKSKNSHLLQSRIVRLRQLWKTGNDYYKNDGFIFELYL